jgi:hypothetical protein
MLTGWLCPAPMLTYSKFLDQGRNASKFVEVLNKCESLRLTLALLGDALNENEKFLQCMVVVLQ